MEDDFEDFNEKSFGLDKYQKVVKRTLEETLIYVEEHYHSFDTVVLDINLDLGQDLSIIKEHLRKVILRKKLETIIKDGKLKENAGLYIFLFLLDKGFPKDRMCFLTGNNSMEDNNDELEQFISFMEQYNLCDYETKADLENAINTGTYRFDMCIDQISNKLSNLLDKVDNVLDEQEVDELESLLTEKKQFSASYHWLLNVEKNRKQDFNPTNTVAQFKEAFEQIGMTAPRGFKKKIESEEMKEWLESKDTDYYKLRRGVIEAAKSLKLRLDEDGFIKFNQDFQLSYTDEQSPYSKEYFDYLLTALEEILPIREPRNKHSIYLQIIKKISHPWEGVRHEIKPHNRSEDIKKEEASKSKVYFNILKLLRNWVAHSKLTASSFLERDVAFLLIVAMRAYFSLERNKLEDFEQKLLELLKSVSTNYDSLKLDIEKNKIPINKSFKEIRDRYKFIHTVNFNQLLKEIGNQKDFYEKRSGKPHCQPHYLMKMLWHGMYQPNISNGSGNYLQVSFNRRGFDNIFQHRDDIFTQLLVHTYEMLVGEGETTRT